MSRRAGGFEPAAARQRRRPKLRQIQIKIREAGRRDLRGKPCLGRMPNGNFNRMLVLYIIRRQM
jgi:hypothetical protein